MSLRCHQYTKKTCQLIIDSGNHYIGSLKGNQSGLLKEVQEHFTPLDSVQDICKAHGRIEKRTVSISRATESIREWPELKTLIRVNSERQVIKAQVIEISTETRYYISSLNTNVQSFGSSDSGLLGCLEQSPLCSRRDSRRG
jgi:hypothetical protein